MDNTWDIWNRAVKKATRVPRCRMPSRRLNRALAQMRLLYEESLRRYRNLFKVHQLLTASQQKYFSLFENAPHPYLLLDKTGRVMEINLCVTRTLGLRRDSLLQTPLTDHLMPDDLPSFQQWLGTLASGEPYRTTARGEPGTFALTLIPMWDPGCESFRVLTTLEPGTRTIPAADETDGLRIFSLLDALPAFVYVQDRNHVIRYANHAFRQIFGTIEGHGCFRIFHHREQACPACHVSQVFATGQAQQWEITDDQGQVYVVHDSLLQNPAWGPLILGVGMEITPRIRAEEALARSEHRFQVLARMAPVGIFRTDAQGLWTFVNPRWQEITGQPLEKALASTWQELIHADDRPRVLVEWHASLEQQRAFHSEFRLVRAGGVTAWVICQATPAMDQAMGFVGMVGTLTDISDRRHMEDALAESERRYRAIVEDQTELISRFRPDGGLTFVNEAYCRYFHTSRELVLGRHFLHHGTEPNRHATHKRLASLTRAAPVMAIEQQTGAPDNRWQKWTYRAIFNPTGQLTEYQAVGRDITEDKKIQEAIFHLKDEMELQERKRLAVTLHDGVGQSMQAINLGLKVVAATFHDNPEEATNTLREMIRELSETIAQLRDITGELRPSFLDRMALVEAMRWWGSKVAERAGVEVRILPRNELPLLGLRIKYNCFQIFREALTNAIKHSGSKEVTVSLEYQPSGMLHLEIADQGKGFDPRRDPPLSPGLGLSIIPERVARLGGTLHVKSEPGQGTTIAVLVPCRERECFNDMAAPLQEAAP